MKVGRPIAFVVLAFMIGAIISQGSFAFADDSSTNPFRAMWEAIGELQTKTSSLQAQIDELKEQGIVASSGEQVAAKVSETFLEIDVGNGDSGQTIIDVVATNTGPESAVGVKISTFYQMSLFDVNFIDGAQCTDQARGIIECYVGTIESGSEAHVTIDATPSQLGEQAIITADVSSITEDSSPENNHAEVVFITSDTPVMLPSEEEEEEQPSEESSGGAPAEEQTGEEQPAEGEQGSEGQSGEEQPAEGEQGSEGQSGEEQTGEETGEQGSEEQASGEEGSESGGEQSGDESGSSEGSESGDSSGDAGSSDGSAGDSGSDSGDSGSSDSGDSGSGDSGSDSGDSGSSGGDSGSTG